MGLTCNQLEPPPSASPEDSALLYNMPSLTKSAALSIYLSHLSSLLSSATKLASTEMFSKQWYGNVAGIQGFYFARGKFHVGICMSCIVQEFKEKLIGVIWYVIVMWGYSCLADNVKLYCRY